MKHLIVFCLLALTLPAPAFAEETSAYEKVITSGTIQCGYFSWPPYIVKDPNTGALSGINYDIMTELGRLLDLKIEWKEEVTAGTAIEGLNTGRYDMMCATLWPDAARLKYSQMSTPAFYSTVYVAVRADDTRFDNGKDTVNRKGIRIAGIDGDITATLAQEKFPNATLTALPQMSDSAQLLQMLVAKKADVVLVDKGTIADFNRTNGDALKIAAGLPPVRVFSENLAVRQNEMAFISMINQALRIMADNGTTQKLIARYPDYHYYAPQPSWSKDYLR